ncbi:Unknown protein [Striga hermonthica]|uniref:DUF4378 domain-containing protein n=1 Tax=Striga hermonthica TaxID=68872 RepID=A0A9N7NDQ5_STRHE|nr:Unknown protein [Striga hermonthica]
MSTGMVKEQNLDKQIHKQMGCMAGFLQIFDRHQILSGKRHYSNKRLPPLPVADTASESERSAPPSPAVSERPKQSPDAVDNLPPQSPIRLEMREVTRSPWKFGKETPRLSLDSRATTDAKGGLHPREIRTGGGGGRCESISSDATDDSQNYRSPSVIARLMGLEPLQDSSLSEPESKPQLRRSASESRVTRDLFQSRFTSEKPNQSQSPIFPKIAQDGPPPAPASARYSDPRSYTLRGAHNGIEPPKRFNSSSPWKSPQLHRRGFYDSGDFFPEPKLAAPSEYVEIESRLRFRGIDEPSRDLDTLKQILEALQLKGLLHSKKPPEHNQTRHRNFIYDESPVVIVRTPRLSNSSPINRRRGINCSPPSGVRNQIGYNSHSPAQSPRRSPSRRSPSPTSTGRNEINTIGRKSNSLVKPKPLSVETQRRKNEPVENRRASPVQSPKLSPRRTGLDPATGSHSPRRKKSTAEIHLKQKKTTVVSLEDESSSISGSSITTSTDTEKSKAEDYKEGRHLLERCDKLLHSIAEMTATDMQPSPVSVLDSSFYKDESSTPSPVTTRRIIDFKDQSNEAEDEIWTPKGITSDGSDFAYVADILRASHYYLPEETTDFFLLLEKQQYCKGKDSSKSSTLQRKLIFDTINEILDRKKKLPPWKATKPSVTNVWSELERIRAREEDCEGRDLFETVCGVLRKDMALARDGLDGWDECHVEISESILDIERLVFKDLITETIRELAKSNVLPRRKLVF